MIARGPVHYVRIVRHAKLKHRHSGYIRFPCYGKRDLNATLSRWFDVDMAMDMVVAVHRNFSPWYQRFTTNSDEVTCYRCKRYLARLVIGNGDEEVGMLLGAL